LEQISSFFSIFTLLSIGVWQGLPDDPEQLVARVSLQIMCIGGRECPPSPTYRAG